MPVRYSSSSAGDAVLLFFTTLSFFCFVLFVSSHLVISVVSTSRRDEEQFTCTLCERMHLWTVLVDQCIESPVLQLVFGHCVHMSCVAGECRGHIVAMQIGSRAIDTKGKTSGQSKEINNFNVFEK